VPEDIAALTAGWRRVFLVQMQTLGAPASEEAYLRRHGSIVGDTHFDGTQTAEFRLRVAGPPEPATTPR
jgi:hypothetical protein